MQQTELLGHKHQVKLAYSVEELSTLTSLSKAYLRRDIREGKLAARRFGRRVIVTHEDLMNYLSRGLS